MKTVRRRRKESKTDYGARLNLLKSNKPRLVVRKTNRYVIAQIVESAIAQDKVIMTITSKDLLEHGWPKEKAGSLKSLAAAYLTGYLLIKKSKLKSKDIILDMGMHRNVPSSRIYAVVKGAIDAGASIPHAKDSLPSEERLNSNKNTEGLITKLKGKI